MKTTYNIGLNNNALVEKDTRTIEKFFATLQIFGIFTRVRFDVGDWESDKEPTAVLVIVSDDQFDAEGLCKNFCKLMTQNAIAMKTDGEDGKLIYHPDYAGEKVDFDDQYFIEF